MIIGLTFLVTGIIIFKESKQDSFKLIIIGSIFIITSKILHKVWTRK